MDGDGNGVVSVEEFSQHRMGHGKTHKGNHFAEIDSNNDSTVSKQEFLDYKQQRAVKYFNKMDTDGNGSLSADEFASHHKGRYGNGHHAKGHHGAGHKGGRYFTKMDADGNGEVTLEEATASWKRWFDKLDANGDQTVSEEEAQAMHMKHGWK